MRSAHNRLLGTGCTALVALVTGAILSGCGKKDATQAENRRNTLVTVPVKRQTMVTDVTSTGRIEPIRQVQIRSKASGKILRLPVETGDVVQAGALLAQVDTTEAATQVRQKRADLDFQRAQLTIAEAKARRDAELLQQGMISKDQYDQSQLEYARIRSVLISTGAALESAEERLRETIVRAPMRGTILEKKVEEGQVITSATSGVSEGTMLLRMADLTSMQVRVLMDQTDFGKIRPGQDATIVADAYRNQKFDGRVVKIEPQSTRERDVTYFPVLIEIDNREGLLLPGMDCTVNIHVSRLENVLTVSTDAVVALDDAEKIAPLLDIPQDTVAAAITAAGGKPTGVTEVASSREQIPSWLRQGLPRPSQAGPSDAAIIFVVDSANARIRPVPIKFGMQDWDVTQVTQGLADGMTAIIPPSAMVAQQFKEYREAMDRYGAGLPGKK